MGSVKAATVELSYYKGMGYPAVGVGRWMRSPRLRPYPLWRASVAVLYSENTGRAHNSASVMASADYSMRSRDESDVSNRVGFRRTGSQHAVAIIPRTRLSTCS